MNVFPLNLEPKLKDKFKSLVSLRGESMTSLLRKFIEAYIRNPDKVTKFLDKN